LLPLLSALLLMMDRLEERLLNPPALGTARLAASGMCASCETGANGELTCCLVEQVRGL
jgi:hypothetical protein